MFILFNQWKYLLGCIINILLYKNDFSTNGSQYRKVITSPDKGNGVVVMDRMLYVSKMYELINDDSKFKKLEADSTLCREGQLQLYLRTPIKQKLFF